MTAMPKYLDDACDSIDAAVFSGDFLHDQSARKEFREYVDRWTREMDQLDDEHEKPVLLLTDAMIDAGKAMLHKSNGRGAREKVERIFSAMIGAQRAK